MSNAIFGALGAFGQGYMQGQQLRQARLRQQQDDAFLKMERERQQAERERVNARQAIENQQADTLYGLKLALYAKEQQDKARTDANTAYLDARPTDTELVAMQQVADGDPRVDLSGMHPLFPQKYERWKHLIKPKDYLGQAMAGAASIPQPQQSPDNPFNGLLATFQQDTINRLLGGTPGAPSTAPAPQTPVAPLYSREKDLATINQLYTPFTVTDNKNAAATDSMGAPIPHYRLPNRYIIPQDRKAHWKPEQMDNLAAVTRRLMEDKYDLAQPAPTPATPAPNLSQAAAKPALKVSPIAEYARLQGTYLQLVEENYFEATGKTLTPEQKKQVTEQWQQENPGPIFTVNINGQAVEMPIPLEQAMKMPGLVSAPSRKVPMKFPDGSTQMVDEDKVPEYAAQFAREARIDENAKLAMGFTPPGWDLGIAPTVQAQLDASRAGTAARIGEEKRQSTIFPLEVGQKKAQIANTQANTQHTRVMTRKALTSGGSNGKSNASFTLSGYMTKSDFPLALYRTIKYGGERADDPKLMKAVVDYLKALPENAGRLKATEDVAGETVPAFNVNANAAAWIQAASEVLQTGAANGKKEAQVQQLIQDKAWQYFQALGGR